MAKKKYTTEYFDITPILAKYDTTYYMIYGEREDGKSYSIKKLVIDDYKMRGKRFVYMRRCHSHIVRRNMIKVFDDLQWYAEQELDSKIYFDPQIGFYIIGENGQNEVIGYCTSIQDCMSAKSIPLVNIGFILFDEFIDYNYFDNEKSMFMHAISTICRPPNENVKIFMLGNTISKDCVYFKMFNIDTRKIHQGEPYYIIHKLGVTATVYHTPTKVDDIKSRTKSNKYIGFDDDETVNMIMFGEWEYNHCITSTIDGVGWNCYRNLIPIYLTALGNVYEFTINMDIQVPILFIRKVNTQYGKCKTTIRYNLTYDRTVNLINKNGIVPTITKVNSLVDDSLLELWEMANKCIECGRVIFDKIETGGEFQNLYAKIK